MKTSKKISALLLAAFICSSVSISAFAVNESSEATTQISQTEDSAGENAAESLSEASNHSESSLRSENSEENSESSETDYSFSAQTKGNANLIASEEVITDDGQFQFVAVTTRDGDVFYVIVDHSKVENNVYFLNEIDTYDLKALLNKNDDGTAVQVGTTSDNDDQSEEKAESTEESDESEELSDSGFEGSLYILIGIAVLVIIGFAIYKIKKDGFGKKKSSVELVDDDFDDDDEINEDKE